MNDIQYPRRRLLRGGLRWLGRVGLPLLTNLELNQLDHFPERGPVIIVGNHTGTMEVVLMTVYAHRQIEYLGSTDIPHPPLVQFFNSLYGLIPVHRGRVSRSSMKMGLSVLEQGGVLGLFPQGGIWEPSIQRIQTGVAWLSYRSGAPILPVGFNSTEGAMEATLRLERPTLTMTVGQALPAVRIERSIPRKPQLVQAAQRIMQAIWDLVPAEDQPQRTLPLDERFGLEVKLMTNSGESRPIPDELQLQHGNSLSKFLHRATLFNNLLINLNLPIAPLRNLHLKPANQELLQATQAILHYLEVNNPYYFTYRYGQREGSAMEAGIRQFDQLVRWARQEGLEIEAVAQRSYREAQTGDRIFIDRPLEI